MKKRSFMLSNRIFGIIWTIFGLIAYKEDLGLAITLWGIALMFLWNAQIVNLKN